MTATLALCGGCAVGPSYKKPEAALMRVPQTWHGNMPHGGSVAELNHWWQRVQDPVLARFVDEAERSNPNIAMAMGRLRAARAGLDARRAGFLPGVQGQASQKRDKNVSSSSVTNGDIITNVGSGVVSAGWELDLFGGTRRSFEASKADLKAAEEGWHDARISLASDVANAYTTARLYQALVHQYEQEVASREATRSLTAAKVKEGLLPPNAEYLMEASAAFAASNLEEQRKEYVQMLDTLCMLTGLPFAEVEKGMSSETGIPRMVQTVQLSVPAEAISQRPDVRAAEQQLVGACARIGVAIADMLPSVSLSGFIGVNKVRVEDFKTSLNTWQYGPTLTLPVFAGGAYRARVEVARASYDQALATYRSAVANAVREVEGCLVRIDAVGHRMGFAETAAKNFRTYFLAMEQSYKEGSCSLLELEDARRQALSSEQALLAVRLEEAQAWISLYKAAGGGWEESPYQVTKH